MPSIVIKDDKLVKIQESTTIILNNEKINIEYCFKDNEYSVLVFNDYDGDVILNDSGSICDAKVKINYLQLDKYNLKQQTKINVNKNSSLDIHTTYLANNTKEIVFDLYNNESDSNVDITNNIVCLDNSNFSMDCIGTIVKGAKRSKCHQHSHCLTIDDPKKARVLPVLNIDENDVEASHSLSSGTIDEEILFYMNTRGLSKKQALNLILKSYLMPSDDYYCNFELGSQIQEKAIKKVDDICLM